MKNGQLVTLDAIVKALETSIKNVHTLSDKERAAAHIVYGVLYGNNAVDIYDFFDEYPELEIIAESALEFDHETDEPYLNECWNRIVSYIQILRDRL